MLLSHSSRGPGCVCSNSLLFVGDRPILRLGGAGVLVRPSSERTQVFVADCRFLENTVRANVTSSRVFINDVGGPNNEHFVGGAGIMLSLRESPQSHLSIENSTFSDSLVHSLHTSGFQDLHVVCSQATRSLDPPF